MSVAVRSEISSIVRMGSASLREAVDALAKDSQFNSEEASLVMNAVCSRISAIPTDMRYWDLVSVLRVYAAKVPTELVNSQDIDFISKLIGSKLSHLSVKHLVDLLLAFETLQHRPRELYTSTCNRLIDLAGTSMYADELVALTRVVGRSSLSSESFLNALSTNIVMNDSLCGQLRFLHSCEVAGAFASLDKLETRLVKKLEQKCMHELDVMPLEELWKTITAFSRLSYSYKPFEDIAWDQLRSRLSNDVDASSFDQVTRPIDFLNFLRYHDLLADEVLVEACRWANDAVFRPATRTQAFRRPSIFEVAMLADLCRERQVPMEKVEKAIRITVASRGGTETTVSKPKPLRYRKRRAYIRKPDGYIEGGMEPLRALPIETLSEELKSNEAAFAPKLRSGGVALWKARSGPWFFRK